MQQEHEAEGMPNDGVEIVELVVKLKSGEIDGKLLPRRTRVTCVAYMVVEGATSSEMALLFGVDERTIRRDLEWLRDAQVFELDAFRRGEIREFVEDRLHASLKLVHELQSSMAKTLKDHLKCMETSWRIMKMGFGMIESRASRDRRDRDLGQGSLTED